MIVRMPIGSIQCYVIVFVVGITDEWIQLRLLCEKDDLTFQKAFEIAIAMELAAKKCTCAPSSSACHARFWSDH